MELHPSRGRSRHVQTPRLEGVDVDGPHDALRIGVGAGHQVERFVLGSVDGYDNRRCKLIRPPHPAMASLRATPLRAPDEHRTSSGPRGREGRREQPVSVAGSTLVNMAFATEYPVLAHSEYRAIDDMVRAGGAFEVVSQYEPAGDQPAAIEELERRIRPGSATWCCWVPPVPASRPPRRGSSSGFSDPPW